LNKKQLLTFNAQRPTFNQRESRRWLRLARRVPLIKPPAEFDLLLEETEALIKIFATSIRTAQVL
jgi:hypothetical protein